VRSSDEGSLARLAEDRIPIYEPGLQKLVEGSFAGALLGSGGLYAMGHIFPVQSTHPTILAGKEVL
jgi:hypothetical protein